METTEKMLEEFEQQAEKFADGQSMMIATYLCKQAMNPDSMFIESLLEHGKTFGDCMNYISTQVFIKVTSNGTVKPTGNFATIMVGEEEVYQWAVDYYESAETTVNFEPEKMMPKAPAHVPTPKKKKADVVDFPNLFDLAKTGLRDDDAVNSTDGKPFKNIDMDTDTDNPVINESSVEAKKDNISTCKDNLDDTNVEVIDFMPAVATHKGIKKRKKTVPVNENQVSLFAV